MKKIWLLFATVFALTFQANSKIGDDDTKAEFKFEKETHDFGQIKKDVHVTYKFKFTNIGEEPIIILKASASCGCTEPKYPNNPIKKGETSFIEVTFKAPAIGPFTKSINIQSNAKSSSKLIYIKGEVIE